MTKITTIEPGPWRPAPFDGRRFANATGPGVHGWADALKYMRTRQPERWPRHAGNDPAPRPADRVDDGTIRVTVVGHATVLLQVGGLNILTDPVLSPRIGPLSWLGVTRVRPPALAFADLPRIDVVLVSHDHYDHLDRPTLAALERRDAPLVLTGLKAGRKIPAARIVELDWWESREIGNGMVATYVPAEHFSGRGLFDRNASLWGGFVIETAAGPVYFAGDTGDGPHFAAIRNRFGPMTVSLIPIGAYAPRWFMAPVHIDPAEAVAASLALESRLSIAIHFGTFALADDGIDAAPLALAEAVAAVEATGERIDFRLPVFGRPIVVASEELVA